MIKKKPAIYWIQIYYVLKILFNPHNNLNFQKTQILEEIKKLEWTYQVFKYVN